jgi:hypothetical protein
LVEVLAAEAEAVARRGYHHWAAARSLRSNPAASDGRHPRAIGHTRRLAVSMILVVYLFAFLFVAKLLWNLGVPYVAWHRAKSRSITGSISLMAFVEVALLIALLIATALDGQHSIWLVSIAGVSATLFTYVHLLVMERILARALKSADDN